jgi:hypothetical protein
MVITEGGKPRTIAVPVEMPQGVSYEGVFGDGDMRSRSGIISSLGYAKASGGWAYSAPPVSQGRKVNAPRSSRLFEILDSRAEPPVKWSEEKKRQWRLERRLAKSLLGLAKKVEKAGKGRNFMEGKVEVVNGEVKVAVWLSDDSEASMKKLKDLGFTVLARAKAARMLIGRIDVAKLEDLALLDFVRRVELPPYVK